ncbi:hypothetical protein LguiA_030280 [Lonicera macranthoides]
MERQSDSRLAFRHALIYDAVEREGLWVCGLPRVFAGHSAVVAITTTDLVSKSVAIEFKTKIAKWNLENDLLAMVTEDSKIRLHRFYWPLDHLSK